MSESFLSAMHIRYLDSIEDFWPVLEDNEDDELYAMHMKRYAIKKTRTDHAAFKIPMCNVVVADTGAVVSMVDPDEERNRIVTTVTATTTTTSVTTTTRKSNASSQKSVNWDAFHIGCDCGSLRRRMIRLYKKSLRPV